MCPIGYHVAERNSHQRGIVGHVVVAHIGEKIAQRKSLVMKTMLLSGPEKGLAIKIAGPIPENLYDHLEAT